MLACVLTFNLKFYPCSSQQASLVIFSCVIINHLLFCVIFGLCQLQIWLESSPHSHFSPKINGFGLSLSLSTLKLRSWLWPLIILANEPTAQPRWGFVRRGTDSPLLCIIKSYLQIAFYSNSFFSTSKYSLHFPFLILSFLQFWIIWGSYFLSFTVLEEEKKKGSQFPNSFCSSSLSLC